MTLPLSAGNRRYGYRKDPPDVRDFGVGRAPFVAATDRSVSLVALLGPVLDQGEEGSCTAHAGCSMREFLHWKEYATRGEKVAPSSQGLYSPAFLYYESRKHDGSLLEGDCGSYGRTVCWVLNHEGVAFRSEEPYMPGFFDTPPTSEQSADALKWKAGGYHRLTTVDDMKSCLSSGYCFMVGFLVYQSFEDGIGKDGIWSPDTQKEAVLGGHEVLFFGYDDRVNGGSFQVRNSWGAGWGDHGNFWMRYQDAASGDVLMDAWMQHLGKPWTVSVNAAKP